MVVLNVREIFTMSTRLQKHLKGALLGGFMTSLLCMHGIVGAATELEPNDTKAQAQALVITNTGPSVSAMMGTGAGALTTDLDLYAFDGKAGDVPSIMVVSDGNWDPLLVLYDSAGNILDMNDDAWPMNPGSVSALDSRLDTYRLAADGRYYVAVTPIPRYLGNSFLVEFQDSGAGGSYSLLVQGVTAPAPAPAPEPTPDPTPTPTPDPTPAPSSGSDPHVVTITVRHWHGGDPALGKFKGKNPIPVAIMSAPGFNAMTMIDEKSLTFGATGSERSLLRCDKKGKDVKVDKVKDGMKDLVCYFRPDVAGFTEGDVQAFLTGDLVGGGKIEGSAALRAIEVSNKKDKSWHKRHNVDPHGKKYRPRSK